MELSIPFGDETKTVHIDLPDAQVTVARSRNPSGGDWAEVVDDCIRSPIGVRSLSSENLKGKRVALITDDWGRPTPASEVIPLILEELRPTGVRDEDITFITASGMHDPMSREDLARKLGPGIVERFRCISHDGGDWSNLAFAGISPQGTPIWINRYAAEADFKIALGRIYLHEAYGYEGGYKMILPGVASYDTITRDHSFNFSACCAPGVHENPSRAEADSVGRMVGIDFLINVVVNAASRPVKAFCGEPEAVHREGIAYGDHEVWGAVVPGPADVVVVSPSPGDPPARGYDLDVLYRAARVAKDNGVIICASVNELEFGEPEGSEPLDESICDLDQPSFSKQLRSLALSDLVRLHEKRNWRLSEREVQWRLKSVRGEFYRRKRMREIAKRTVVLTTDLDSTLRKAISGRDGKATVTVIPEGRTTLAKFSLYNGGQH